MGQDGGGIHNDVGAELFANNVVVSGNTAWYGGGIWNAGEAHIYDSTISSNSVSGSGGGIVNNSNGGGRGLFTITNSIISDNTAARAGGGR